VCTVVLISKGELKLMAEFHILELFVLLVVGVGVPAAFVVGFTYRLRKRTIRKF
jgi:hypothetical protein